MCFRRPCTYRVLQDLSWIEEHQKIKAHFKKQQHPKNKSKIKTKPLHFQPTDGSFIPRNQFQLSGHVFYGGISVVIHHPLTYLR